MMALTWTLTALATLSGLIWVALALRLLALRPEPELGTDVKAAPPDAPPVAAIIAARDEERDVESAVRSVIAQDYPNLRILVIDDQSTDRTGAILDRLAHEPASRGLLQVLQGADRPPGWIGKTWAVQQGFAQTTAPWLWFVDADMTLHPRALAAAIGEALEHDADLVSLFPRADCRSFWQGATALMLGQILTHLFPTRQVNNPNRPEALAAGGFLLVRRSAYERAGGHEAVRAEIIEDIQLARLVKASGGRLRVRLAPDLASTHMYGTVGEIWRGLRKNAYAGMDYQFHKFAVGSAVALVVGVAPPLALAAGLATLALGGPNPAAWSAVVSGALAWSAEAAATLPLARFLRLGFGACWSMPAGIALYLAIAASSVWHHHRGRVLWKGRVYTPREVASGRPEGS